MSLDNSDDYSRKCYTNIIKAFQKHKLLPYLQKLPENFFLQPIYDKKRTSNIYNNCDSYTLFNCK